MSKIAWVVTVGLIVLVILALGASLFLPFWARGFGFNLFRPELFGRVVLPFLVVRGIGAFLFWLLLILGVFLLFGSLVGSPRPSSLSTVAGESSLDILKRRYARGEISKEQYEEVKSTLGG